MLFSLLLAVATANPTDPSEEPPPKAKPWDRVGWGWGGVPAINVNSDEGFGFGVVGSLYRYDGKTQPYKTGMTLILFATTRAIQYHSFEIDALRLWDLPLRVNARFAFDYTIVDNYCGVGSGVTCDPALAEAEADQAGLSGEERDNFVRRYFLNRYLYPNIRADARYALDPMPHRFELFAGYRLRAFFPGNFTERTPWPGSLYDQDFGAREQGFVSVLEVGAMLDNRDNEPAPIRGYWIEGSVRGAHRFIGSDWDYFGFNVTLRGYIPVFTERLVLADRIVVDGIIGDAPIRELANPGGSQRYTGYGSLNAGRGIRQRRFVGETFAMNQTELRGLVLPFKIAKVPIDIHVLGFADVGFVGAEFSDFFTMFRTPLVGGGGGLRVAIDKNFIVRGDIAWSAFESTPSYYVDLRNLF